MTRKQIYIVCTLIWALFVCLVTDILFSTHHLAELVRGGSIPLLEMNARWWWSAFELYVIATAIPGSALYAFLWLHKTKKSEGARQNG